MSDNVLKLIPKNPIFIPRKELFNSAQELLENLLPDGEMCEVEIYDNLQFIDAGANLTTIICPICKKRNDIDVVVDWWDEICANAEKNGWESELEMPCCKSKSKPVDLEYDWPVGFSLFELSIWNPNITKPLPREIMSQIEQHLGCELKEIWAHY